MSLPENKPEIKAENFTRENLDKRPLSSSSLKAFCKSPKHYIKYLNEKWIEKDAFILGSTIDCLALEPDQFDNRFLVYRKPNLRSNAGKAEYEQILLDAKNKRLITEEQFKTAEFAVQALMDTVDSRILIENAFNIQKKLQWKDRKTGFPLIGYQDFQSKAWDSNLIVDLKSTRDGFPENFNRDIAKFDYGMQSATYRNYYKAKRFEFPDFIFLAVETVDPFNVTLMYCDNKFNEKSDAAFRGALDAFKYAMKPYEKLDKQYPNHFHLGYEFALLGSMPYFAASYPPWKKPTYEGYDEIKDEED